MAGEDMLINTRVRRIFAKYWLDATLVSIMTHRGVVHIAGVLHKIHAIDERDEVNEDLLQVLEQEIKRIKGVKRIIFTIDGWVKDGGQFKRISPVKRESKTKRAIRKYFEEEGEGN